jgi:hypothetical protein
VFWANRPMAPIEPGNVFNAQCLLGQLPRRIYREAVSTRLEDLSIGIEDERALRVENIR